MRIEHEFLQNKDLKKIFKALNFNGENCAMIVGGAVRNAILGLKVHDIDIATILKPNEIIQSLLDAKINYVPTGIVHGTISAIINKKAYEITSLRHDIKTDGRHAIIGFTNDWNEDAKRRDFTINALYCDLDGNILDPTNQGINAINKRIIEFVGNPKIRIKEDFLRILRLFRFFAQLPNFEIDKAAIENSKSLASNISSLSKERIWSELKKICNGENCFEALNLMENNNILANSIGNDYDFSMLENLKNNLLKIKYKTTEFMVFCALLNANKNKILKFANDLRLSNQEKNHLINISKCREFLGSSANNVQEDLNIRASSLFCRAFLPFNSCNLKGQRSNYSQIKINAACFEFSNEITKEVLLIFDNENLANKIAYIDEFKAPIFPYNGDKLGAMGIKAGINMGLALKAIKKEWLENNFSIAPEKLNEIIDKFKH